MAEDILTVTLYTREDCKLCEEVKKNLENLREKFPHRLVEINIDSDSMLKEKYGEQIPVVDIGPYQLKAPITKQSLEMTLGAARDRRGQLQQVGGAAYQERVRQEHTLSRSDSVYLWISKHYLAVLNVFMFLYVGLPFAAPTLMKLGAQIPARVIYTMYSPLCHQFAFRSFFLFGEQPYYPLTQAGVAGVQTFDQISGLNDLGNPYSVSRLYARQYIGNPTVGYKVAFCERDVAIYAAILLFGLIFALTGRRIPPLHWLLWGLIGIVPIAVDGFWQLFSEFNWPWLMAYLPYHESTPFQRVLTGFLFGFATAWFAYPAIEESMKETREFFVKKFAAVLPA
jgi:uncharacterized membrane protein/glutaredoxin